MDKPRMFEGTFTVVVREVEQVDETKTGLQEDSEKELEQNKLDMAVVKRVIDADTIEVVWKENVIDVRLLLIDAPETVHPDLPVERFGAEAVTYTKQLLIGKQVQLEYDGPKYDSYGRLLAYVWVDRKMVNELLLEKGLAHVAYVYHPPYKYYDRLLSAQRRAKDGKKGIWATEWEMESLS